MPETKTATKNSTSAEIAEKTKAAAKRQASHLKSLEALLADVKGNYALGNARNVAGYLQSVSLLAGSMARVEQQIFELDVIDELENMEGQAEGLANKRILNLRELQLRELEAELTGFLGYVSSSAFPTQQSAAASLRKLADSLEEDDMHPLFVPPMTTEESKAWAKSQGYRYVEAGEEGSIEDILSRIAAQSKAPKARKRSRK